MRWTIAARVWWFSGNWCARVSITWFAQIDAELLNAHGVMDHFTAAVTAGVGLIPIRDMHGRWRDSYGDVPYPTPTWRSDLRGRASSAFGQG